MACTETIRKSLHNAAGGDNELLQLTYKSITTNICNRTLDGKGALEALVLCAETALKASA